MIVGAGKSEIHRAGQATKLEALGESDFAVLRRNFFFLRKYQFCSYYLSNDGIRPIHIIEDSFLYLKLTDFRY